LERLVECDFPTEFGIFRLVAYRDSVDGQVHLALAKGPLLPEEPVLVRVHLSDVLCDLPGARRPDCGWPLQQVLQRMAEEGSGVIVLLRQQEDPKRLIQRIQDMALEDRGVRFHRQDLGADLRSYGIGAQILADLGVRRMRVLSAPKKLHALGGFGLEVVAYVS
jgi:3,4-dihydroxy 2-butanone 4-phosphate synthase/GTP cyclohydrolase II